MTSQEWTAAGRTHPVAALACELTDLLDGATDTTPWSMTPQELKDVLPRLTRARARLEALELRVLVEADRVSVGDEDGASNTAAWWAHTTGQTRPTTHRALRLAQALDERHARVAAALAAGELLTEQAHVIVAAVDTLPADLVDAGLRARAEARLVELGREHDARDLRRLGHRILEHLAPDVADEHERRVLEREERHARETARFTMTDDGHGSAHGRFTIPALAAAMLRKHLMAIAAPRHQPSTGEDPAPSGAPVSMPLRLGRAFVEYVETRPDTSAPRAGGVPATVVVTMTLEQLLGAESAATLDSGDRLSGAEARRVACEAGIIPVVLGGAGAPLDVGRRRRFHTEPMRVAMILRDGGCTAEGCDWPPSMCHAHHPDPWSRGGRTSLANGRLLCPRHHTLAHDGRYQMKASPGGKVCFSRRT